MSNYTMATNNIGPVDIGTFDINGGYNKKFPNQKINISVHSANGGYILEVSAMVGQLAELYIIHDGQDLGQEIGKIITHKMLKENHE